MDVLKSQADLTLTLEDSKLLDRASSLGRVLITQDEDFLREAADRQKAGKFFAGIIFVAQDRIPIRRFIEDLEIASKCSEPEEFYNRLDYLPLR